MEMDVVPDVPPVSAEDEGDEGVNYYCRHANLQALYDEQGQFHQLTSNDKICGWYAKLVLEMQGEFPPMLMGLAHMLVDKFFILNILYYCEYFSTMMQAFVAVFFDANADHGLTNDRKVDMMCVHCLTVLYTNSGLDLIGERLANSKDLIQKLEPREAFHFEVGGHITDYHAVL
jgi:hypothetical protein